MVNNITFSKDDKITGINVGFPCCKNVTSSHFQYHQRTKCSGPPKTIKLHGFTQSSVFEY